MPIKLDTLVARGEVALVRSRRGGRSHISCRTDAFRSSDRVFDGFYFCGRAPLIDELAVTRVQFNANACQICARKFAEAARRVAA